MASSSRIRHVTAIIMAFLLTMLVTRIADTESIGNVNERDDDENGENAIIDDVFFEIIDPPELGYTYRIRPAQHFGTRFNASLSGRSIALVPVEPEMGCVTLENPEKLYGNVALVLRGDCTYFEKSEKAQEAGARAIIIADYYTNSIDEERESPLWMDYYYIDMTVDKEVAITRSVNIPAGFLLGKNGKMIKDTLRRLNLPHALINIPINMTFTRLEHFHQPPWTAL